ncbi:2-oxoadipate dioxygenase/decarboxylase [Kribbella solani]|uniref:2-oxoadipate dioxygenase/decarboxylase n=1 Tax=Kribbella solani TaxID=236067 RepID=A0A841E0G4_9ACTN|nr:DUF1338 family protein [Kribbella solani]MBB5983711.1 putative glyoxalase superfamily metalloenzyme YdcJ [Kribbella solani]
MTFVDRTSLRARLAVRLSELYGREVPAYRTLVEVAQEVNERVLAANGSTAERFGSLERVTAERHGAVRVGTPAELSQLARIFGAVGMYPVGFYDLRDAHPQPIPVISTAFRPLDRDELAANPFRVFTSMLVPQDRRFFDADLEARLTRFLEARTLFPAELLELADRSEAGDGLGADDADRFLDLATASFALSAEPVDRAWYAELEAISGVAADIGGVTTTHINHLTPRVLDIDDLYRSMTERGIEMIDAIQGPPAWDGPEVLLRQTSFRALAEPRRFRDPDGTLTDGTLRVRFGEVEARGIALTPLGRARYDELMLKVEEAVAGDPGRPRQELAAGIWSVGMPSTERELERQGLAYFSYHLAGSGWAPPRTRTGRGGHAGSGAAPAELDRLLDDGSVILRPIVYEDFLPRSAAGIFSSNLSRDTTMDESADHAPRDATWLTERINRHIHVPEETYAAESHASLRAIEAALGLTISPRRIGN